MKKKNIFGRITAVLLALVFCLSFAGCSDMLQMFEMFQGENIEMLEEGQSIYSLSMFDSLPSTFSSADPLFWVAEGSNGGKVYLLGSIHIADKQAYRIPEKIMNAFLSSDALAVECDIVAAETDYISQMELLPYYMYQDGSTISDHVSPELYDAMVEYYNSNPSSQLSSLGYTIQTLNTCKPSMWQSAFETILSEHSGLDSNLGIDRHFLTLAKSMSKQIIEVESVKFQASLFDSFPDELNEMLLWDYVSYDVDEYAQYYYESYQAWLKGDAAEFYTETITDYTGSGMTDAEIAEYETLMKQYNDALLHNRNVGMADTAENMLKNGQNVFYVVGAAHMGGSTGIVTLLRERGWKVTQLGGQNADPYTTPGVAVPTQTVSAAEEASESTTTASTTTAATTSTAASDFILTGNLDNYYDQYVELYEHFGGTTRKDDDEQTTTTSTSSSSDSWNNWGSR